ncbi:MAG: hypothetical protein COA38_02150 [Fluviicola sp.]|nr:MAG: hypothetical protein COA38_02150 [Fluviicola sp.]
MKIVAIITYLFISGIVISQNSYYFSNPLPTEEKKVQSVDKKWFGEYKDEATSRMYSFTPDGLTIISTQISSVSKKLVRESSKYSVKGDFIHGVVKNDSLRCVLEKGYYFFGIRNRDAVVYKNSTTQLTRINEREYMLNYEENGIYVPMKLAFSNGELTISEFDYDPSEQAFDFVQTQSESKINMQNVVVLSPSKLEFDQLNSRFFKETSSFSLITE